MNESEQLLDEGKETVDADFRLHPAIAQATGNRYFVEFMAYLSQTVIPRTGINAASSGTEAQLRYLRRIDHEHEETHKATESQNATAASNAMQMHLSASAALKHRKQMWRSFASD